MLGRSKTQAVKDSAARGTDLAVALARDKRFRKQLLSAVGHGAAARQRAASRIGLVSAVHRLGTDKELRSELHQMTQNLKNALTRVEKKRSHKLRNVLLVVGGIGAAFAAAAPRARKKVSKLGGAGGKRLDAADDQRVDRDRRADLDGVQPVDAVRGLPAVHGRRRTRGAARRHAPALDCQGRRQDGGVGREDPRAAPRQAVSWISEDGKKTRGTVTFEPVGESKTRITLSMSYQAEGLTEALGSAVGLDERRVRGDLERFKELIESRGAESGAWRGEVSAGTTK